MYEVRSVAFPQRENSHVVMKEQEIQTVLTSFVGDYIMRAKLTRWFGPQALVNGGWCSCVTKQNFEGPQVRHTT